MAKKPTANTIGIEALGALENSYAYCQRLARRSASNFYFSFLLLPRAKRRAMCALYAYLRHVGDLGGDGGRAVAVRRAALEQLRGAIVNRSVNVEQAPPILPALMDTVTRYRIPTEYLTAVIDGGKMDFVNQQYQTFEELELYCERVASVVGLACIHIWGFRGPEALEPARRCG